MLNTPDGTSWLINRPFPTQIYFLIWVTSFSEIWTKFKTTFNYAFMLLECSNLLLAAVLTHETWAQLKITFDEIFVTGSDRFSWLVGMPCVKWWLLQSLSVIFSRTSFYPLCTTPTVHSYILWPTHPRSPHISEDDWAVTFLAWQAPFLTVDPPFLTPQPPPHTCLNTIHSHLSIPAQMWARRQKTFLLKWRQNWNSADCVFTALSSFHFCLLWRKKSVLSPLFW